MGAANLGKPDDVVFENNCNHLFERPFFSKICEEIFFCSTPKQGV
jgi:hypothetical protein